MSGANAAAHGCITLPLMSDWGLEGSMEGALYRSGTTSQPWMQQSNSIPREGGENQLPPRPGARESEGGRNDSRGAIPTTVERRGTREQPAAVVTGTTAADQRAADRASGRGWAQLENNSQRYLHYLHRVWLSRQLCSLSSPGPPQAPRPSRDSPILSSSLTIGARNALVALAGVGLQPNHHGHTRWAPLPNAEFLGSESQCYVASQ